MAAELKGTPSAGGVRGREGQLQAAEERLDETTVNPGVKAYMALQQAILVYTVSKTGFPTGCVYHYTSYPGLLGDFQRLPPDIIETTGWSGILPRSRSIAAGCRSYGHSCNKLAALLVY